MSGTVRVIVPTAIAIGLALSGGETALPAQEGSLPPPFSADVFVQVQDLVVEGSPALAAARASLDAARARLDGAGLAPPAVLSGEVEDVAGGRELSGATFRVEVGREFLTGGRSAAARALASAEAGLAVARLEALERQVRGRALVELTRLATARAVALRLAAQDTLLASARASVTDRFSAGTARYVDILRVQTEQLRVRTDIAGALADERAALEGLLGLVDVDRSDELLALASDTRLPEAFAVMATLPPPPALDSLVALAAPVALARATEKRTIAAREVAASEARTRFAGSLGLQRFVEAGAGGGTIGPVLGGSVTLPFTAGRANAAARRAAERDLDAAEATLAAERSRVRGLLAGEAARYDAARERLEVYDVALLAAARDARESALGAYRTGDFSLVELLDFERAVATSEIERLRALAAAVEAYTNLISGGLEMEGVSMEWSRQ